MSTAEALHSTFEQTGYGIDQEEHDAVISEGRGWSVKGIVVGVLFILLYSALAFLGLWFWKLLLGSWAWAAIAYILGTVGSVALYYAMGVDILQSFVDIYNMCKDM